MTTIIDNGYDAGFLNVPGFGQSATNPMSPVFYDSLGIVKDLSVYQSMYAAKTINAGKAFNVGKSSMSDSNLGVGVPARFLEDVNLDKNLTVEGITSTQRLVVRGKEYVEATVVGKNGTFRVLAAG